MTTDALKELERLVSRMLDGETSSADTTRLDTLLSQSPEALERYHELLDNHQALCAIYPGGVYEESLAAEIRPGFRQSNTANSGTPTRWQRWALAAAFLVAVGLTGYFLGRGNKESETAEETTLEQKDEQAIAGHATLRRAVGMKWSSDGVSYREGDVLPGGLLRFEEGVAEIDFFCGATLIIEGPAILDVQSDWVVAVSKGRLRANVPRAARGFVVKAAGSEIVDLGTQFALEVAADNARLEVIDGEVKLQGGDHDGNHLTTGQRQWLKGTATDPASLDDLSTVGEVSRRRATAQSQRLARWRKHSQQLQSDRRLIAYYPLSETATDRVVRNQAVTGTRFDGTMVGSVTKAEGRFGSESMALEFDRPGARGTKPYRRRVPILYFQLLGQNRQP